VLQVSHVSKQYPTPRGPLQVLADVTFTLSPGEAAAITGPSGSGKSSLLYILGALDPPSSGTVTLDGRNPFALSADGLADFRNAEIGFVFQDHCLLSQCSVLENVLVPTLVATRPAAGGLPASAEGSGEASRSASRRLQASGADSDKTRAGSLIAQVGLGDRIDHRPGELSGGEKQRVAIARALIRQPRLVLCDEPTGNLDQASASTVASLLLDLHRRQQNILIVVTHSDRLASRFPIRFEIADSRLTRVG
jgi:lipoprotein-releasing system ATP-binding protein